MGILANQTKLMPNIRSQVLINESMDAKEEYLLSSDFWYIQEWAYLKILKILGEEVKSRVSREVFSLGLSVHVCAYIP